MLFLDGYPVYIETNLVTPIKSNFIDCTFPASGIQSNQNKFPILEMSFVSRFWKQLGYLRFELAYFCVK